MSLLIITLMGFVMAYFEDNCISPGWNNPFLPVYTCPNPKGIKSPASYQDSGKYVRVCNESDGDLIFYDLSVEGDHSAAKENIGGGQFRYISKYGSNGPLVAHRRDSSFYHLNGLVLGQPQFWAYVGSILGNNNIVGTSPVSFTIQSKPGVTYSWSIVEGLSKVFISSVSNQPTVTLTPTHSGTAKLRLTINSGCGAPKIQELSLTIQTNVCLEGTYNIGSSTGINLNTTNQISTGNVTSTVTCPNATSFTWQRTSGSVTTFNTSGNYVTFNMVSGGSISFSLTARNGSTVLSTRNVSFFNFGSFSLYPNPSSNKLAIDLNPDLKFDLVLQGLDSKIKLLSSD
ncbi:hypothetical protein [Algoriphagus boritolerans]|uniref:Ig-like domain-containing protein n=1 Tax=Algoriphagus boritolerans DSM 17298 = JCM 18970 TaxID=1120964 RepID=A0A1H5YWC6_9BACT|nr:hypothetical protein [Algoriphagus boritolerans]SEG27506.1 hypothetical protein SAMN03080598_03184 [Algoriphagus boritolerans DSM 17298 = JCM 18970]